jgi:TonB family protein
MMALVAALTLATTTPPPAPAIPLPPLGIRGEVGPGAGPPDLRPEKILIEAGAAPREVTCADGRVAVASAVEPVGRVSITFAALHAENAEGRQQATFRIAPDGRTRDIHVTPQAQAPGVQVTLPDDDEAALAVWRFAPSAQGHQACHAEFRSRSEPLSEASPGELFPLIAAVNNPGAFAAALLDQAGLGGGSCLKEPRAQVLEAHFPDPDTIPGEAGRPLWVIYRYDLDAHGRRVNVRRVAGETTPRFDQATRAALEAGRNQPKPRTGCMVVYRHAAAATPAPPVVRPTGLPDNDNTCPGGDLLTYPTPMAYPPRFAERGVEGWAFIGFDVAPWGAIGNAKVLASEPADAFGTYALNRLTLAKAKTPGRGYTNCVLPVHFKMPKLDAGPDAATR